MITNKKITYYHKTLGTNKLEEYDRYIFENVWAFGGKGSSLNAGYENANDVNIRIPMEYVTNKEIFKVGDIVAIGVQSNIEKQSDLDGKEFYNIRSITINEYGNNPHIHLGGI